LRLAVFAALALASMQAVAAARIELTFDEAYYALWARWPQAGYFDHPPLVAWMISASQAMFGGSEFGVRALFWAQGAALTPLAGWIGWRLYGDAATPMLLLVAAPLLAGAPLATPDTPLTFFWTLTLAGLVEVWRARSPPSRGEGRGAALWLLVGLAAGLAGLAKMTAGFLALGLALALLGTPSLRREFRRPGFYAAGALGLAVVSPFLIWNAAHDFATFHKQGGRIAAPRFAPRYLGEFLAAQFGLLNPLGAGAALLRARRAPFDEPTRLLAAFVAPALAYFILHALHDRVQGNWPAPLYPALALLAARAIPRVAPFAAGLGLVVIAALYAHLLFAWPAIGPTDPALRIGGWRALAAQTFAGSPRFVVAQGYAATSLLAFYGPKGAEVAELDEPERWTFRPAPDLEGEGLAFGPPDMETALKRRFAEVRRVKTLRRQVGGVEVESYSLFAVSGAF